MCGIVLNFKIAVCLKAESFWWYERAACRNGIVFKRIRGLFFLLKNAWSLR